MAVTRGDNQTFNLSDLSNPLIKVDDDGNVEVFLYCNEVSDGNLEQLLDLGLIVEDLNEEHKIIQGWMPYENLEHASEMGFVVKVTPPSYAHTRVGSVTTEGDGPINADDARNTFGVDGSGIKICVISDGVDSRGMSQATGDLPGFIEIGNPGGGDEGTAILEIIHDVAPGADLAFHTAFPTSVQFLNAINFFTNINCDIIIDDVGFLTQPYFQDGELAQAAQDAVDNGIIFVSAAGNDAQRHYQAFYVDDGGLDPDDDLHDFGFAAGGSSDVGMTLLIPGGGRAVVFLQWSDPFGSSSNDYDLFLVDTFTGDILDFSTSSQDGSQDPSEFVIFDNPFSSSLSVDIIISKFSGTAQTLEMNFNGDEILTEFNVPEDSIYGHPAALGVLAVAAFDWMTPSIIESFSSQGPVSIISPSDAVVSTRAVISELRAKPDISGPDGVSTTAPGFDTSFFGTSASAAHLAAVAALVLQAVEFAESNSSSSTDPTVATRQVKEVTDAILNNAVDIGPPGFDPISGFGGVDAFAALQSILGGGVVDPPPPPPPGNGNNSDGGGGCSLQGPVASNMKNSSMINILILFIPALVLGVNSIRRKK